MRLDDRFMTMMTALVLIIAIGAIVQGTSDGNSIFGGSKTYKAKDDTFSIRAGRTVTLDVLLNDANADTLESGALTLVGQPLCGVAEVIGGAIQYDSPPTCSGQQTLTYCVPTADSCELATVTLAVLQVETPPEETPVAANTPPPSSQFNNDLPQLGEDMSQRETAAATALPTSQPTPTRPSPTRPQQPTALAPAESPPAGGQAPARPVISQPGTGSTTQTQTPQTQTAQRPATQPAARPATGGTSDDGPAPVVFADVVQGTAPQSLPQVSMGGPSRLSAPRLVESISPAEATAGIRRANPGASGGTQVAGVSEQVVTISRDSARAGSVASSGFSMNAPDVSQESSSGIRLSGLQPSTQPRVSTGVQPIGAIPQPSPSQPAGVEVGPAVYTDAPVQLANLPQGDLSGNVRRPAPSGGLRDVEFTAAAILQEPTLSRSANAPNADTAPRPNNGILGVSDSLSLVEAELTEGLSLPNRFQLNLNRTPGIELASVRPEADLFQRRAEPASHTSITLSQDAPEVEQPREAFMVGNPDFIVELNTNDDLPTVSEVVQGEGTSQIAPVETASLNLNATQSGSSAPKPVIDVGASETSGVIALPSVGSALVPFALPENESASIETAALTSPTRFDPAAPADTLPNTGAQSCDPYFTITPGPGAELDAELYTPCRPEEMFTVRHETLAFTAMTDASGRAYFTVPAFFERAQVSVLFDRGRPLSASTIVSDLNRVTRVAIVWSGDADMNLRAREYGASVGSTGEIWQDNAGSFRTARRSGGGYMTILGTGQGDRAVRAEVYTLPRSSRNKNGLIELTLEVADPGSACGSDVIVSSLRTENAEISLERDFQVRLAGCDNPTSVVLRDALRDIRVSRR